MNSLWLLKYNTSIESSHAVLLTDKMYMCLCTSVVFIVIMVLFVLNVFVNDCAAWNLTVNI